MTESNTVLSSEEMSRAIRRMSHELLELDAGADNVVLLGIITRGVPLAHRVAADIATAEGTEVPVGELDITMYRDDLRKHPTRPVGRSILPKSLDDAVVVLVDDVLNSGRTVQAALHAIADLGRPRRIQLMVLVDRGHRELPIQADIVGKSLPTARSERVRVRVAEIDGSDEVIIERTEGAA
ncbi:bifunctional pyr operon transcriptional regulator/uracil phosphoribosyltransferase PyrR [Tessaracoccus sp. OS52]|uniref:bifunctional pyr operon transcriptional regulator/uracil phosphoribosyltransferase PyrR n=1 Tax=Tessaracoccus sp. OS52 TaxID=2886691 RepID=UPI001D120DA9|nr:bifunctional pyr operon transcriptional regulator/uracil phosphoribosyltransferase PyrR [Tessaracoccus sp. OS52]MCC2592453.1 bifunctional pyr operon transcriptional regulator/uracil phosphoribosyltransferase PyrR [Tessaracoccus sp. OS52]